MKYCALCFTELTGKQQRWCSETCKKTGNKRAWRARWMRRRTARLKAAA